MYIQFVSLNIWGDGGGRGEIPVASGGDLHAGFSLALALPFPPLTEQAGVVGRGLEDGPEN